MKLVERALFILLLATIPIQLGKHFWPAFSFVDGIRVDYLSPTLYFSDIVFVLLFLASINRLRKELLVFIKHPLFIALVLALVLSTVFALRVDAAVFGVIKAFEFIYLAFYVAKTYAKDREDILRFTFVLGGLVQVVILFFQFVSQKSLGSLFYYLGERAFSISTPGIALFNWNGELVMRPYGTFPHPNVLAYYLLCGFTFLLYSVQKEKGLLLWIKCIALLFLFAGIILTFSRIIILFLVMVVLIWISQEIRIQLRRKLIGLFSITMLIVGLILTPRYIDTFVRDATLRFELITISFKIIASHPFFGVGLNNVFYHQAPFQQVLSPTFYQPVHNIFILWTALVGMIGGVIALLFVINTLKTLRFHLKLGASVFYRSAAVLVVIAIGVGMFDHYLLTLQQGQLLLSLLLGLSFSRKA